MTDGRRQAGCLVVNHQRRRALRKDLVHFETAQPCVQTGDHCAQSQGRHVSHRVRDSRREHQRDDVTRTDAA